MITMAFPPRTSLRSRTPANHVLVTASLPARSLPMQAVLGQESLGCAGAGRDPVKPEARRATRELSPDP
jgi:hypothetical protein